MQIRELNDIDLQDAMEIQSYCWNNDYAGVVPANVFDLKAAYDSVREWLREECEDIRVMYGAFIDGKLAAFVGASIAEREDSENGVEVNYLFVKEEFRNRGLGLKLLQTVVNLFMEKGFEQVIIYNWHDVPSNKFYRGIGGTVLKQLTQTPNGKPALVDVFVWNCEELEQILNRKIESKYI